MYGSIEFPWFMASDVAEWIEHSNSRSMMTFWYVKYLYQFIGIHIDTSPNEKSDLTMKSLFQYQNPSLSFCLYGLWLLMLQNGLNIAIQDQ